MPQQEYDRAKLVAAIRRLRATFDLISTLAMDAQTVDGAHRPFWHASKFDAELTIGTLRRMDACNPRTRMVSKLKAARQRGRSRPMREPGHFRDTGHRPMI